MIVVMKSGAAPDAIDRVCAEIVRMGGRPHLSRGEFHDGESVVEIGGGKVPKVKIGGPHRIAAIINKEFSVGPASAAVSV